MRDKDDLAIIYRAIVAAGREGRQAMMRSLVVAGAVLIVISAACSSSQTPEGTAPDQPASATVSRRGPSPSAPTLALGSLGTTGPSAAAVTSPVASVDHCASPAATPGVTPTLAVIDTDRDLAGSLQELVTLSDIIAIGLLTGEPRVHGASSDGFIEHLAQPFRVDRAIRGSVQVGTSIEVIRSVRASDGVPFVDEGAQPLEVGKSYLLFLRSAKDVYVTTSGPQGQFAIVDDRVCSLKPQP